MALLLKPASAGCCMTTESCRDVFDVNDCTGAPIYYEADSDCIEVEDCAIGCCCEDEDTPGEGMVKRFCDYPYLYVDANVDAGDECSCGGAGYSISGTVTDTAGQAVSYALVSAGGRSTSTDLFGSYTLSGVTAAANLRVTASKQPDCTDNSVFINLNDDMTGVDITLNCICKAYGCNVDYNDFCDVTTLRWTHFDLSNPTQKTTYCAWCGERDNECIEGADCIGGDRQCPPGCTVAEDSDCACNIDEYNGVCPPGCGASDRDCILIDVNCGDGYVSYPYEDCDPGPDGLGPFEGQLSRCAPIHCRPATDPNAPCNCMVDSTCDGNELDDYEDCEIGMVCSDGELCNAFCQCDDFECTGNRINPTISLEYSPEASQISVSWTTLPDCVGNVGSYMVYRCENSLESPKDCDDTSNFNPYPNDNIIWSDTRRIYDRAIDDNSEYCYYVQAIYVDPMDGITGESDIACQETGDSVCMEYHADEFCLDNARYECDSDNTLDLIDDCTNDGEHCMGPDADGLTQCIADDICGECNGLYGMFANLDLRVIYGPETYYCLDSAGRDLLPGCYEDRTKTLFSEFKYCGEVSSCYDYKSQEACDYDPCDKLEDCEWAWMFGGENNDIPLGGIFGGICRPILNTSQRCSLCDDPNQNWLSITCNAFTCPLFGDCFYQGPSASYSSAPTCTSLNTFNCRNYQNQADCTGGRGVSVDATYNSSGAGRDTLSVRISGTHSLVRSNDAQDLGKCYWDTANGRCMRNADNFPQGNIFPPNSVAADFRDCGLTDTYCESDFTNPETTILPTTYGAYPAHMSIIYRALDNYPLRTLETFFCINTSTNSCYPNELPHAIGNYSKLMTESGEYSLYYYTMDPAKNLEPVKHISILVDAISPFITITSPSDEGTFITDEEILTITGITSTDTRWLCMNNTDTRDTFCINNCAIAANIEPCISDSTGIFTINVSIDGTELNEIIGYAEDFAGNVYVNTLLGIIRNIDLPPEANITIKPLGQV